MKKQKNYGVFITMASAIVIMAMMIYITTKLDNKVSEYSEYVGEKIVLDQDTLIIIDYSVFSETFELSNGMTVRYELVRKQKH